MNRPWRLLINIHALLQNREKEEKIIIIIYVVMREMDDTKADVYDVGGTTMANGRGGTSLLHEYIYLVSTQGHNDAE